MGFLGGLLKAATSFIPGVGPILSEIVPGVVETIGKVVNRPEGQSVGEALLGAAPEAISGVAEKIAPQIGGKAGKVIGAVGRALSSNATDHLPIAAGGDIVPHATDALLVSHGAPGSATESTPVVSTAGMNVSGPLSVTGVPASELYNVPLAPPMAAGLARTMPSQMGAMPPLSAMSPFSTRGLEKGLEALAAEEPADISRAYLKRKKYKKRKHRR